MFTAVTGLLAATVVAPSLATADVPGGVPRPDHIVILIMENHSSEGIIGNPEAPYLNELAQTGANMTQSYGLTHPSQPNYIGLFSGALNGVLDNSCPNTINAPNLGAQLISAGFSFVGYSEDLPSVGYAGCGSGAYARKHSPWINFPSVPTASNQPLTAFPSDYSQLPTVSMVIPNLQNDMHDGTITQADTWVHDRFDSYVAWAKQNNSLLIVTWDEDDDRQGNHIPTMIVGGGVRTGNYSEYITHYNVLRTIQDAYGLPPIANSTNAAPIVDIWSTSPGAPPTASFTSSCSVLSCTTNASASADADGTVTGYTWNWGDGTPNGSGAQAAHTYQNPGTYIVTLTVTDNDGLVASTTRPVVVTPPGAFTYATDAFGRTVASGWGTADVGGAWTIGGSAASVGSGSAKIKMAAPGGGTSGTLGISAVDIDAAVDGALDKAGTGSGTYLTLKGRRVGTSDYEAKIRWNSAGQLNLYLSRVVGGVETTLKSYVVPGTVVPGTAYRLRMQLVGSSPTTMSAKAWPTGSTQPAAWQVTATDSTAGLQSAGALSIQGSLSTSATNAPQVLSIDNLSVTAPAGAAVNQPPVAVAAVSCTGLTCNTSSAGSSDPDGSISSYDWNWGDNTTHGLGADATHTYATPGTYSIVLAATDNSGATTTTTKQVTVTAPINQLPVPTFTSTCAGLTCTTNATGSTDPDGAIAAYDWDWGDGTAHSAGVTSTHTYAAAGTYTASLGVIDNMGGTAQTTRVLTVVAPPPGVTPFAADLFARTISNGLGTADTGGVWSVSAPNTAYSVAAGNASMTMPTPGSGVGAYLNAATSTDTDLQFGVATDKIANNSGTYITVVGRRVASNLEYDARIRIRADGSLVLALSALKGNSTVVFLRNEAILPGVTTTAGNPLRVRLQVYGTNPTTIRVKVWSQGSTEPASWQASVTDSTAALQKAGAVGVTGYLSGSVTNFPIVLRVRDLSARPTVA